MSTSVQYETQDGIATITFKKPESLNALDEEIGLNFKKKIEEIKKDFSIRVLIITGAGRAFSSGGNLDMLELRTQKSVAENKKELKKFYQFFLSIKTLSIPVIAAINGAAVGAGFCLALACDLRYAIATAPMGANFSKLGLAPGMGGTYLITKLAGPVRAAEILYFGELFTAQQALDWGLINEVVEENLLEHVQKIAKKIASNGPISISKIKKGIQMAETQSLETLFDYDSQSQAQCFTTQDIKEGIAAVREKRPPHFKGK